MISKKEYSTIVKNNSPKSKCFVNGTKAFFYRRFHLPYRSGSDGLLFNA